jgi:predicted RNA binding protein YcfA (HicA-like mRNA interferase family)
MAKSPEFIKMLSEQAWVYIRECVSHTKIHVAGSGKEVQILDRHIPTIDYFLRIWMPMHNEETINRKTWYEWLKSDDELKSNTIKSIEDEFKSLAKDIVANEGKGIFYAKNALGMHDKQHIESKNVEKFDFDE